LENTFGTETENGGIDIALDGGGASLDDGAGADLVEDELGVTETGLGRMDDGFDVERIFGRWVGSDGQLWS